MEEMHKQIDRPTHYKQNTHVYLVHLQVQLLISAQDVENYKLIKADLDRLRTLVEKSELWVEKKGSGGGDGKKDKKDKKEKGEVRCRNMIIIISIYMTRDKYCKGEKAKTKITVFESIEFQDHM